MADGLGPDPLDGEVARAGIEEFVVEFLPGLLAQEGVEGLGGTLHLFATDGPAEWWIDLDTTGSTIPGRENADTAVRGSRSDLSLADEPRTAGHDRGVGEPAGARSLAPSSDADEGIAEVST